MKLKFWCWCWRAFLSKHILLLLLSTNADRALVHINDQDWGQLSWTNEAHTHASRLFQQKGTKLRCVENKQCFVEILLISQSPFHCTLTETPCVLFWVCSTVIVLESKYLNAVLNSLKWGSLFSGFRNCAGASLHPFLGSGRTANAQSTHIQRSRQ